MPPAKTNSACKRVKHSRKDILLALTNENDDDDANDQMIAEYSKNFHSSFDQPSSYAIDPSILNPTTDQLSLSLSQSANGSLASVNRSTSLSSNRLPLSLSNSLIS